MDYALYDLFTGSTVHTRAGFVKAVDATTVDTKVKRYAVNFQDAVWERTHIPRTVTQLGPDELEFTVRGGKVTAEVTIEPTSSIPPDLTTSQFTLQDEIGAAQSNYIGAAAYWIESFFYKDNLRSGGMASVEGNGVLTTVYGKDLTASIFVAPTQHG